VQIYRIANRASLSVYFEASDMKVYRVVAVIIVLGSFISPLIAQNLESIGKEKPLTITGGVSLNQIFYAATGINSRRDPYTYYASGNVNFSLYGWSIPVSFSVSNQNTTYQQPFNQYSVHPTYKWFTGHAGHISMSFSPYTVNGHIFLGGGVDVAPEGKWKFSGLYGRFLRAVEPDTVDENAAFRRMGYGFKASYGDEGAYVDITLFRAKDDIQSIAYVPDSLHILPEENLVASIGAGKTFFDHFLLQGEIASSALTLDTRAAETSTSQVLGNTGFLFRPRVSSTYYKAFKTSLTYQQDSYSLGAAYERVDPGYRTHGAYYFNNDLENITVNGSAGIMEGKMTVAVSAGTQRDNLDDSKVSTMRRFVGSLNVNYIPTQKLNLSASYSSFQTYTNIRSQFVDINQLTPYDNLDTLNFTQISQNATAMIMYSPGSSNEKRQSVNLNLSFQDAADKQGDVRQNTGSQFYNVNTSYSLNIVPKNLTATLAFNGNVNKSPALETKTFGPTASVSKGFFERKLRAMVSVSYNNSYVNSGRVNSIVNGRVSGGYTLQKKHNLNLSMVVLNRKTQTEITPRSFTEFTGTLGYSYAFGIK
jgi:hypothetical protein